MHDVQDELLARLVVHAPVVSVRFRIGHERELLRIDVEDVALLLGAVCLACVLRCLRSHGISPFFVWGARRAPVQPAQNLDVAAEPHRRPIGTVGDGCAVSRARARLDEPADRPGRVAFAEEKQPEARLVRKDGRDGRSLAHRLAVRAHVALPLACEAASRNREAPGGISRLTAHLARASSRGLSPSSPTPEAPAAPGRWRRDPVRAPEPRRSMMGPLRLAVGPKRQSSRHAASGTGRPPPAPHEAPFRSSAWALISPPSCPPLRV